ARGAAGRAPRRAPIGRAGRRLAPLPPPPVVLGADLVRTTVLGQYAVGADFKCRLRAGRVEQGERAVQPHPPAGPAELLLVEEVVCGEQALLAVDGRLDGHGELALAREEVEPERVLAPRRDIAVLELLVDRDRPGVEEWGPVLVWVRDRLGDAIERPDLEGVTIRH